MKTTIKYFFSFLLLLELLFSTTKIAAADTLDKHKLLAERKDQYNDIINHKIDSMNHMIDFVNNYSELDDTSKIFLVQQIMEGINQLNYIKNVVNANSNEEINWTWDANLVLIERINLFSSLFIK